MRYKSNMKCGQGHNQGQHRHLVVETRKEKTSELHVLSHLLKQERTGAAKIEVGTSQSHRRHKKGHMTNIYLTDSGENAIVNFVEDHENLYNKTNVHFKDKERKECLWERFANSLSRCAGPGRKGHITAHSYNLSLVRP